MLRAILRRRGGRTTGTVALFPEALARWSRTARTARGKRGCHFHRCQAVAPLKGTTPPVSTPPPPQFPPLPSGGPIEVQPEQGMAEHHVYYFHRCQAVAPLKLLSLHGSTLARENFHRCQAVAPLKSLRRRPQLGPGAYISTAAKRWPH